MVKEVPGKVLEVLAVIVSTRCMVLLDEIRELVEEMPKLLEEFFVVEVLLFVAKEEVVLSDVRLVERKLVCFEKGSCEKVLFSRVGRICRVVVVIGFVS